MKYHVLITISTIDRYQNISITYQPSSLLNININSVPFPFFVKKKKKKKGVKRIK